MPTFSVSVALLRALLSRLLFKAGTWIAAPVRLSRELGRFLWIFFSKVFFRRPASARSPPSAQNLQIPKSARESKVQEGSPLNSGTPSYTIIRNGDIIPLQNIATSSFPFSNGNIRNHSRSSLITTDFPDRSRPSSRTGSVYDIELLSVVSAYPRHSATRSQYSESFQSLRHSIPEQDDTLPHTIEIICPNDSPTTTDFPSNTHHGSSPVGVSSITSVTDGMIEGNSLQVPRSVSSCTLQSTLAKDEPPVSSPFTRITLDAVSDRHSVQLSIGTPTATPVVPQETKRYEARTKIRKEKTEMVIRSHTLEFSNPSPPPGWIRYAHPEGARYFYHKEKGVYTDSEIYDDGVLAHLEDQLEYLEILKEDAFPKDGQLVLNVYRSASAKSGFVSQYYCVDHHARLIFFLSDFEAQWFEFWEDVQGVISEHHLHHEMTAQYWYFVQLYPHSLELSKDMVDDLRDIVLHLIGDSMTSPYSTAAYTLDDLYKILSLTGELQNNVGPRSVGAMSLLARKMYIFNHARFLNFHGESYARIERNFSVYGEKLYRRTWLIKTLSFALFSAPDVHLLNLQRMWVDKSMHRSVWLESMKRMSEEWQEFVFFATVVLNANVAFLAIQSVDVGSTHKSAAQICSYVSVISNAASIILGLLLMRQNRTKRRETVDEVQNFLLKREHRLLGLESLAILFSLPYALLMWGVVSFLAAFCLMCLAKTNVPTRIVVGAFACAMASLIAWCIYLSWENEKPEEQDDRPLAYGLEPEEISPDASSNASPYDTPTESPGSSKATNESRSSLRSQRPSGMIMQHRSASHPSVDDTSNAV